MHINIVIIEKRSPTGIPCPSGGVSQVSGSLSDDTKRRRLNSSYIRELTRGRFLIKFEEITLLENIGQGMYVCHGSVYLYPVRVVR